MNTKPKKSGDQDPPGSEWLKNIDTIALKFDSSRNDAGAKKDK
jgi:hypothetical protein